MQKLFLMLGLCCALFIGCEGNQGGGTDGGAGTGTTGVGEPEGTGAGTDAGTGTGTVEGTDEGIETDNLDEGIGVEDGAGTE